MVHGVWGTHRHDACGLVEATLVSAILIDIYTYMYIYIHIYTYMYIYI